MLWNVIIVLLQFKWKFFVNLSHLGHDRQNAPPLLLIPPLPSPPPLKLFCSIFQTPCLLRPHVYSGPKSKETFWVWLWFCFKPTIVLKVTLNKDLFLEIFRSTTCWYLMNWFLNQFYHIRFLKVFSIPRIIFGSYWDFINGRK